MQLIGGRWVSDEEVRARAEAPDFGDELARNRARIAGVRLQQPTTQLRPAEWSAADFAAAVARVCNTTPERVLDATPEKVALAARTARNRSRNTNREWAQ